MSWLSDLFSDGGSDGLASAGPAERILQLRRGVSAAAAALPAEHRKTAQEAVEAADALADRVAEIVETPGPQEDVAVETPGDDVDAAGWLREGPARRREAGGPAGREVADADPLPDEVAERGAQLLSDLHFSLLRMEIHQLDRAELSMEETIGEIRSVAERLSARAGTEAGRDGGDAGGGEGSG